MGIVEKKTRKEVAQLKPYVCARQTVASGVLLNANENPFGAVVGKNVEDALGVELSRYPDPMASQLCEAYSRYAGVSTENVIAGSGSDELIDTAIRVFAGCGDEVVDAPPTFEMYDIYSKAVGAKVVSIPRDEEFRVDFDALKKAVGKKTKIVFLATPNNPTGNACRKKDVLEFAQGADCMVLVDEAYFEFCGQTVAKEASEIENLIVFRTLSKAWGLAGARAGFFIGCEKVAQLLLKLKHPYNVNALSQKIGVAALAKRDEMEKSVGKIISERRRLWEKLSEQTDWKVYSSDANFILCRLPKASSANGVFRQLIEKGVVVRDFSSKPFLENCLRMTVGTPQENKLLLEKIGEMK